MEEEKINRMAQIDGEPIRAKAQIGQANERQLYKLIQNANIEHETTKTGRPNKHDDTNQNV